MPEKIAMPDDTKEATYLWLAKELHEFFIERGDVNEN